MKIILYSILPILVFGIGLFGLYGCWEALVCVFDKNLEGTIGWISVVICCYVLMHVVYQIGKWFGN